MSSSTADNTMDWHDNPFPASAVARFSTAGRSGLNIDTPAVAEALSYLNQYLDTPDATAPQRDGNVIAIVGEYGTGKTHLTIELLRRVAGDAGEKVHSFYLDAPADTFLALYRDRFFRQLDRKDVRQRVAEYYADIVAEELVDSPLTEDVAHLLLERRLEPHQIIQDFGLSQSAFQQELQARLGEITEHEDFGKALGLFMRPEFEAAVWEWLAGHPADAVLQERGIRRTIDNDIAALEAIGVFAFLYGRQDHRFVLIIDEFEKVLSRDSRSVKSEASVLAFKKLLEVFSQARSLLILSGLPDFIEVLPEDAQQRISCIVRPTALSFGDVRDYIRLSLGKEDGDLTPFNEDSIAYLVELAGGNARKVIRLCYHAYESSVQLGSELTRAMIREVARKQFEISSPDDIRSEVTRILDSNGWAFELGAQLNEDPLVVADYWLPVGQAGSGCAVIITQSVLHEHEAESLVAGGQALLSSSPNVAAVLVINGYLAESLRDSVTSAFARVMQYSPMRFPDDFSAAVNAFVRRLEEASNEDRMSLVESKLEQLLRQTSGVRKSLDSVQRNAISPYVIESAVDGGLRRIFQTLSGDYSASTAGLPSSTDQIFRAATDEIQRATSRMEARIRAVFVSSPNHRSSGLPDDFSESSLAQMLDSFCVSKGLAGLVGIFRDSIAQALAGPEYRRDYDLRQVSDACRTYDRCIEDLVRRLPAEFDAIRIPIAGDISSRYERSDLNLQSLAEGVWDSIREITERRGMGGADI
ncbi:hypothetical protein [Streptomyces sp. NPDC002599]|uniref:hypothetical protein n=1 Tax=Streptomyces sp. NPDC002599 TaxID=3154421 RepID=UPI003320D2E0